MSTDPADTRLFPQRVEGWFQVGVVKDERGIHVAAVLRGRGAFEERQAIDGVIQQRGLGCIVSGLNDVVINDLNPLNGKCEYIKALIYIKMGDPIGACPLLATSRDSGYSQASATFDQYCR